MKVAVTLEQLWHRVPGGTATSAIGTTRAVAAKGDAEQVGVAAFHRAEPAAGFRASIAIRRLWLPRSALYESWHRLRAPRVQRATGPVDVIHATTLAIPPRSAPLVVTVHDLTFLERPDHFTARGMRLFLRGLELVGREADVVIVPSEATRRDCTRAGIDAARIRVVPWGVDVARVPSDRIAKVRADFSLERPYILWTGTVEPRKNLPRLLAAFAQIDRPVELVLAGPRGWGADIESLIAGDARVRALGLVAPDTLAALYGGAEIFCYPSLKEGFGLPVLEAMAQGVPVITSAGTSTEEVAGDAALLVDPEDHAAVRSALERLLDDRALAERLGDRGRERAGTFSWSRTAELTVAAYRTALEA